MSHIPHFITDTEILCTTAEFVVQNSFTIAETSVFKWLLYQLSNMSLKFSTVRNQYKINLEKDTQVNQLEIEPSSSAVPVLVFLSSLFFPRFDFVGFGLAFEHWLCIGIWHLFGIGVDWLVFAFVLWFKKLHLITLMNNSW